MLDALEISLIQLKLNERLTKWLVYISSFEMPPKGCPSQCWEYHWPQRVKEKEDIHNTRLY